MDGCSRSHQRPVGEQGGEAPHPDRLFLTGGVAGAGVSRPNDARSCSPSRSSRQAVPSPHRPRRGASVADRRSIGLRRLSGARQPDCGCRAQRRRCPAEGRGPRRRQRREACPAPGRQRAVRRPLPAPWTRAERSIRRVSLHGEASSQHALPTSGSGGGPPASSRHGHDPWAIGSPCGTGAGGRRIRSADAPGREEPDG